MCYLFAGKFSNMHDGARTVSKWPVGTSGMHARVRGHDWSATPLGPIRDWPQSLRFAVDSTLAAGFPTLLLWGRDLLQIYNDAYMRLVDWLEVPLGAGFRASWPDYYERAEACFESVLRGETIVTERLNISFEQLKGGRPAWLTSSISPVRDEAGGVTGISMTFVDSTPQVLAEMVSRENEAQLTQLLDLLPVGVTFFDTDRNAIWRNPEMQRLLLQPPQGHSAIPTRVFDDEDREVELDERPIARALRGEFVRSGEDLLFEVAGEQRWLRATAVPFMRDGKVAGCIGVAHDITEAKNNADHMKVLIAELQHRTRNVIAVVQALANKTLEPGASLAKYLKRLGALARVQGLLSYLSEDERVTFSRLLRTELEAHAAFDGGRVTLEGPAGVRLRSGTVQTLALALHELATNATKHGALAQPSGHLRVRWHVEPSGHGRPQLCVDWRESGVVMPEAGTEPQSGYGRELIERALPYQPGVKTTYQLGVDGVHCTLRLPIAEQVPI